MASSFPDYYAILGVDPTATPAEIRQAYKVASLRSHPDRLGRVSAEQKRRATEEFQAVADAYFILSDAKRRQEYDSLRNARSFDERTADPMSSANFFAHFANMFTGTADSSGRAQRPNAEGTFGNVFEELLRPEVERIVPWWSWVGTVSGGALGFIIANIPGLLVGSVAGNRVGAIRDAKGKSVATVFAQLGMEQRTQILRALAAKVLHIASGN